MRCDTSRYFYDLFTRQQWARFDAGSYRLAPAALTLLKGVNEPMPYRRWRRSLGLFAASLKFKWRPMTFFRS